MFGGVNVHKSGDRIIFDAYLLDGSNAQVITGSCALRIFELQSDGTLKSFDFNDHTFKTTTLTTETLAMTHRTSNNGATNTGYWTAVLTALSAFTVGKTYLFSVSHASAVPVTQMRKFVYGGADGDLAIDSAGNAAVAPVYWAEVDLTFDDQDSIDKYEVRFMKNGAQVATSGVTSPVISVVSAEDDSLLVDNETLVAVGSQAPATFKYNATGDGKLSGGERAIVVVAGTIDGLLITRERTVKRDQVAA